MSELDRLVPVYQFRERHSIGIRASKERADVAIRKVTAKEIFLFRTLTWIRRRGRRCAECILNPPPGAPILEVATRSNFLRLADVPGRELVLGTAVIRPKSRPRLSSPEEFQTVRQPGYAVAAMNFAIGDGPPGECTVTTETRVFATDAASRRRFGLYWAMILPGSAFLRKMWLRAIKRRAEGPIEPLG
ncbi:MAG: hypothetical protein ACRD16_09910 [Thermoanaerobaculia bacterium]